MTKSLDEKGKKYSHLTPVHLVALIDLSLFALLAMSSGTFDKTIFLFGLVKVLITYFTFLIIKLSNIGETYMTSIVSLIVTLGLAMQFRLSTPVGIQQFIWFALGVVVMVTVTVLFQKVVLLRRASWLMYSSIVTLFILTLTIGIKVNGAKNWLMISGFSFQPSELIKILFVLMLASSIAYPDILFIKLGKKTLPARWTLMAMVFSILGFFVLQREYGTALVVFMVYVTVLYVFERQLWFAFFNLAFASLAGALAVAVVPHIKVRMTSWISPFSDMSGNGYQITQSLFAIGTGGFFGTGIGLGHPDFIPNVSTDFIFSAICEEMGLFGSVSVLLLYFLLIYRGIKISMQLKDPYFKVTSFGLTVLIGYQTFVIVGGVTRVIPLTGITLPFISYGGSSLITSFLILGILQALSGELTKGQVIK